jgi:hypothetical protein
MEALRSLDQQGIVPTAFALREPSLDDVFLALTGRRAEVDEENGIEKGKENDEGSTEPDPTQNTTDSRTDPESERVPAETNPAGGRS